MKTYLVPTGLAALSMIATLFVGWQVHAETNRVTFPEIDKLVHYTTVRRGNVTELRPCPSQRAARRRPVPAG